MDRTRMLEKCRQGQWEVGDLDWSREPPAWPPEKEARVVQYFTDMAGIERLAGALFAEQRDRARDPVLKEVFDTFVRDELRHSHCAQMLADHYDVNRLEYYAPNANLRRFAPHFVYAVRFLSAEFANIYITTGEIILDIALLRSLDDFCDDPMVSEAMARINRDESRHLAVDYHMLEYYASDEWAAELAREPAVPLGTKVRAWWAFASVLRTARPFFQDVFFGPMRLTDPTGRRIREAFKRLQLVTAKQRLADRPFTKFLLTLQALHNHPLAGPVFRRLAVRVLGVPSELLAVLYDEAEWEQAAQMSFAEHAQATLGMKHA